MSRGWRGGKGWGGGCVRPIMKLMKSWGRRGLIVEGGRNGGGGRRGRGVDFLGRTGGLESLTRGGKSGRGGERRGVV